MLIIKGILTNDDGKTKRDCVLEPTVLHWLNKKDIVGRQTNIKEAVKIKHRQCHIGCLAFELIKTDGGGNPIPKSDPNHKDYNYNMACLHCIKYKFPVEADADTVKMLDEWNTPPAPEETTAPEESTTTDDKPDNPATENEKI